MECQSCGHSVEQNYCPNCGEKAYARLKFKDLASDFFSNLLALEAPILRTMKELTIRPGHMCREYISGIRKPYYKPFQYYLVWLTVFYALFFLLGDGFFQDISDIMYEGEDASEMDKLASRAEIVKMMEAFNKQFFKLFIFVQIPILVLLLKLFFRKQNYNATEFSVYALYQNGHGLMISALLAIGLIWMSSETYLNLNMWIGHVYFMVFIYQFFEGKGWIKLLKGLLIYLIASFAFAAFMAIISLVYVILKYNANLSF